VSALPFHVVFSVEVTNLLSVLASDISSASNTTLHVFQFTLATFQTFSAHQYPFAVFTNIYPVVAVQSGKNSDRVTAQVLPLTDNTASVGVFNNFQLASIVGSHVHPNI
jgi:hypothetical protein